MPAPRRSQRRLTIKLTVLVENVKRCTEFGISAIIRSRNPHETITIAPKSVIGRPTDCLCIEGVQTKDGGPVRVSVRDHADAVGMLWADETRWERGRGGRSSVNKRLECLSNGSR